MAGRAKPDYRLAADDLVRLPPLRDVPVAGEDPRTRSRFTASAVRDAIVYEDERILVFNKPAGLAVHGGSGLAFGADRGACAPCDPMNRWSSPIGSIGTPAAACWSRGPAPRCGKLHALLRVGQVEKHYTALVAGRWQLGRKKIDAPVLTHARQGGERVVRVHAEGKSAVSVFTSARALS